MIGRAAGADAGVLVVGGTGGVGEACVRALLADPHYACVIATSRDRAKLEALRKRTGATKERLVTVAGSVANARDAEALRDRVLREGELGAVVASLGGWWEGRSLLETDDATWRDVLDEMLTTHFVCARTFIPLLARSEGRYVALGGGAGLTPVPNSALVSIAAAAQAMLTRALVAERGATPNPVILELIVDAPVKTRGRHHGPQRPDEITADEVAAVVRCLLRDGTTGEWPAIERCEPLIVMRAQSAART